MTVNNPRSYDFHVARADECRALAAQGLDADLRSCLEWLAADYQSKADAMGNGKPLTD